ncbi:hypothetical protein GGQ68_001953 [Sagittula marina]|uniref:Uncharacterized protein n=1 Tax=Sagittula marina TaxID=943940 RepID=A0A7W6DS25_9RHOB|nr:hypothetical protein [Sagittula marina]MBB3985620.1 hypothetical protein [Sagittula marina]
MDSLIFAAVVALPFVAFARGVRWTLTFLLLVPTSWALYALWVSVTQGIGAEAQSSMFTLPRGQLLTRVALTFCIFPAVFFGLRTIRALRLGRNMALCVMTEHLVFAAHEIEVRHLLGGAADFENTVYWSSGVEQAIAVISGLALLGFAVLTIIQLSLRVLRGPASHAR